MSAAPTPERPAGLFQSWPDALLTLAVWLLLAAVVVVLLAWLVLSGAAL